VAAHRGSACHSPAPATKPSSEARTINIVRAPARVYLSTYVRTVRVLMTAFHRAGRRPGYWHGEIWVDRSGATDPTLPRPRTEYPTPHCAVLVPRDGPPAPDVLHARTARRAVDRHDPTEAASPAPYLYQQTSYVSPWLVEAGRPADRSGPPRPSRTVSDPAQRKTGSAHPGGTSAPRNDAVSLRTTTNCTRIDRGKRTQVFCPPHPRHPHSCLRPDPSGAAGTSAGGDRSSTCDQMDCPLCREFATTTPQH